MAYCIFMHRADSIYDDRPSEQYQFPKQYLGRAEQSVGDWIVYLEPSKVKATRGYFATAKVQTIIADPKSEGMFLAIIEPNTFLDFPSPVSFNDAAGPIESGLLNESGKISGRAQAAVRPLSHTDFAAILNRGLADNENWPDRYDPAADEQINKDNPFDGVGEGTQAPFERQIVEQIVNRKYRDVKFKHLVRRAYDRRCAFTGLRLINGKGRPEVEAAHIKPVKDDGPDTIRNGIALSGTVHWMFDRGMLTLTNKFKIQKSRQLNHDVSNLLVKDMQAIVPSDVRLQPHPDFLQWHRENVFKQ